VAVVVALVDDLMFLSRIREAAQACGIEVRRASSVPALLEACRDAPRMVLMDLDSPRLPLDDALAALRADPSLAGLAVLGFFSHVRAERGRHAREAGCTRVLPRSAFVQQLPELLAALA
jgi:CheY-like chemotaxis protein